MPGSTYLYIHDKDSEKIRRHRRYAKFSPIRHIQSKFQIPYTKRCYKKKSRFIQKYITICLVSKMISLHLQHQTHI